MKTLIDDYLYLELDEEKTLWFIFKVGAKSIHIPLSKLIAHSNTLSGQATLSEWFERFLKDDAVNRPDLTPEQIGLKEHASLTIAYAASEAENAALRRFIFRFAADAPSLDSMTESWNIESLSRLLMDIQNANLVEKTNEFLLDGARLDKLERLLRMTDKALFVKFFHEKTVRESIDAIPEEDLVADLPEPV